MLEPDWVLGHSKDFVELLRLKDFVASNLLNPFTKKVRYVYEVGEDKSKYISLKEKEFEQYFYVMSVKLTQYGIDSNELKLTETKNLKTNLEYINNNDEALMAEMEGYVKEGEYLKRPYSKWENRFAGYGLKLIKEIYPTLTDETLKFFKGACQFDQHMLNAEIKLGKEKEKFLKKCKVEDFMTFLGSMMLPVNLNIEEDYISKEDEVNAKENLKLVKALSGKDPEERKVELEKLINRFNLMKIPDENELSIENNGNADEYLQIYKNSKIGSAFKNLLKIADGDLGRLLNKDELDRLENKMEILSVAGRILELDLELKGVKNNRILDTDKDAPSDQKKLKLMQNRADLLKYYQRAVKNYGNK